MKKPKKKEQVIILPPINQEKKPRMAVVSIEGTSGKLTHMDQQNIISVLDQLGLK